jgi:DNA polymerase III delta prime subunit
MKTPLILTGPPGCGKSHWIQKYAEQEKKQLFVCACRKDRTLRDGRQKLHIWARRTEPAILWLEGADDLTPEAQAFLRRILETHSQGVIFILECRDSGRLQEPIRSRCMIKKMNAPSWNELEQYLLNTYKGINTNEIYKYLHINEYSYRRAIQSAYLQLNHNSLWKQTIRNRELEYNTVNNISGDNLVTYMKQGINPHTMLSLLMNHSLIKDYGKCIEVSGSLWAFLGSALYRGETTTQKQEE